MKIRHQESYVILQGPIQPKLPVISTSRSYTIIQNKRGVSLEQLQVLFATAGSGSQICLPGEFLASKSRQQLLAEMSITGSTDV